MLCVFYRWQISSVLDDDCALGEPAKKHLLRCDRCREFFNMSVSLGEGLANEASVMPPDIPVRLSKRIRRMTSRVESQIHAPSRRIVRRKLIAACVLFVCILGISGLGLFTYHGDRRSISSASTIETLQSIFETNELTAENLPAGIGGLLETPVSRELKNLTNQTESAVQFLVTFVKFKNPAGSEMR